MYLSNEDLTAFLKLKEAFEEARDSVENPIQMARDEYCKIVGTSRSIMKYCSDIDFSLLDDRSIVFKGGEPWECGDQYLRLEMPTAFLYDESLKPQLEKRRDEAIQRQKDQIEANKKAEVERLRQQAQRLEDGLKLV